MARAPSDNRTGSSSDPNLAVLSAAPEQLNSTVAGEHAGSAVFLRDGPDSSTLAATQWTVPMRRAITSWMQAGGMWQKRPAKVIESMGGTGSVGMGFSM
jgi:hypothetical protein